MKQASDNMRKGLKLAGGLSVAAVWLAVVILALGNWQPEIAWVIYLLLPAAVVLTVCAVLISRTVFAPMDELSDVVANWGSTVPEDLEKQLGAISGPAGELGKVLYGQMAEVERRLASIEETTREETTRTVRGEIREEICRTALPQVLKEYPSREFFKVAGLVRPGQREHSVFYDYFYVDPGLLCVSIGQVPNQSISAALYMVTAQAAIRSRLHHGRSVAETMSDVNAQMYDYGAGGEIRVLVGTLDTGMGHFTFVNAGISAPMLMQGNDRYEKLNSSVSTPLGRSQDVSYREEEIRLRQGDRLFLYTEGLAEARDRQGVTFETQELRSVLNRSLSRKDPEQSLQFLADEAAAFCPSDDAHPGYAALLLEYRKGEKDLEHCRVPGTPEHAGTVLDFVKARLEDNGIQRRHYARVAVLTDELFTLCCRSLENGEEIMVECGVAPDAGSVTIRMSGPFHGRDPLSEDQDALFGPAADYIRNQGEYVSFDPGGERDAISVVCFFSGASAPR